MAKRSFPLVYEKRILIAHKEHTIRIWENLWRRVEKSVYHSILFLLILKHKLIISYNITLISRKGKVREYTSLPSMAFVTGVLLPYGDKGAFIAAGGVRMGGPPNRAYRPRARAIHKIWGGGEVYHYGDYRGKGGMKGSCGWICIDVEKGSAPSQEKRKTIRHLTWRTRV